MAELNLSPEIGEELATRLTNLMDTTIQDAFQELFNAVKSGGEDANLVEGVKGKVLAAQNIYNEPVIPTVDKVLHEFEQFTDIANHIKNLQMDTSVKQADVGTVKAADYDALNAL